MCVLLFYWYRIGSVGLPLGCRGRGGVVGRKHNAIHTECHVAWCLALSLRASRSLCGWREVQTITFLFPCQRCEYDLVKEQIPNITADPWVKIALQGYSGVGRYSDTVIIAHSFEIVIVIHTRKNLRNSIWKQPLQTSSKLWSETTVTTIAGIMTGSPIVKQRGLDSSIQPSEPPEISWRDCVTNSSGKTNGANYLKTMLSNDFLKLLQII
jgi:hypothetical protein